MSTPTTPLSSFSSSSTMTPFLSPEVSHFDDDNLISFSPITPMPLAPPSPFVDSPLTLEHLAITQMPSLTLPPAPQNAPSLLQPLSNAEHTATVVLTALSLLQQTSVEEKKS